MVTLTWVRNFDIEAADDMVVLWMDGRFGGERILVVKQGAGAEISSLRCVLFQGVKVKSSPFNPL